MLTLSLPFPLCPPTGPLPQILIPCTFMSHIFVTLSYLSFLLDFFLFPNLFLLVCQCVCCMCVCAHTCNRRVLNLLLFHSPLHSFEACFLIKCGARLVASKPQWWFHLPHMPSPGQQGCTAPFWVFIWGARAQCYIAAAFTHWASVLVGHNTHPLEAGFLTGPGAHWCG